MKAIHALWISVAILAGLTGCVTSAPSGISPDPGLLSFLMDGTTQRSEVLSRLGEPSALFEQDHIITYRISGDPKRGYWIRERVPQSTVGWTGVHHSLVLVFNETGVLQRHSLVVVQ